MQANLIELFASMPLNDVWIDAALLADFQYLYSCKYVRTDSASVSTRY